MLKEVARVARIIAYNLKNIANFAPSLAFVAVKRIMSQSRIKNISVFVFKLINECLVKSQLSGKMN